MTEINKENLNIAIRNLPVHQAGDYVWEELRWQLEKPLAAELPLHHAPDNAWESLAGASGIGKNRKPAGYVLPAAILVALITIVLFPVMLNKDLPEQPLSDRKGSSITSASGHAGKPAQQTGNPSQPVLQRSSVHFTSPAEEHSLTVQAAMPDASDATLTTDRNQPFAPPDFRSPGTGRIAVSAHDLQMQLRNDRRYDDCPTFRESRTSLFMMAGYSPDFYNTASLVSPGYNFSLGTGIQHNRLSIALGVGYARLSSHSELTYEYRTNELVYSYDYVDSVYIDPVTLETYYFTVRVDVYDSIDYVRNEKMTDHYSYMQFPVSMSYEIARSGKFALGFNVSAAYHYLHDNQKNFKPFYEASSRLVSVITEERKLPSDYWSASGGLMVGYDAGSRIGISFMPLIRYSSLSVTGTNLKGVTGFGFNFGIRYKIIADR